MKGSKVAAALEARQKSFDSIGTGTKTKFTKPGSMNPKKGYGRRSTKR